MAESSAQTLPQIFDNAPIGSALSPQSILTPLTNPNGGPILTRMIHFTAQPPVKRALPWFIGVAGLGAAALTWASLSPAPQRILYAQLDDSERASVVTALEKAAITYHIDNNTGTLTVGENDLYKARMLVAQDGALATPDTGGAALNTLPMGASRMLEGEHMRSQREHELMLTIKEIDGVESVRVHLAEGEKSVFIRDNLAPTASVMLRLGSHRQLSQAQVTAIVNLVAGSVPGLSPDAVRVVDQHGRLLTDKANGADDRVEIQARLEDKMRNQLSALLTPMLGEGNFSSEVQAELDMSQLTSARESYDKQGVLRSETQAQSQNAASPPAIGVPGALSNTPPPNPTPAAGAPQGTTGTATGTGAVNGESSATRSYELGREVAVSNQGPGKIKRLSVAVALSAAAMKKFKQSDIDQIKQLISATVGADPARGDQVAVMVRSFDAEPATPLPFYETSWFAMAVRTGAALIGVMLVLLLGVRPIIKAIKGDDTKAAITAKKDAEKGANSGEIAQGEHHIVDSDGHPIAASSGALPSPGGAALLDIADITDPQTGAINAEKLGRHVNLAQKIVEDKPNEAVLALRQMLQSTQEDAAV
ncbi:MAG: hypothetical protein RLY97_1251 [Pseudomonadota bacterium]